MPVGGSEPTVNTTGPPGVGASGWSVTTHSQPPLPGGGRGGCQWVVSDHQQSTTPTWWSRVGASGWSVTTNSQPPLPGGVGWVPVGGQ